MSKFRQSRFVDLVDALRCEVTCGLHHFRSSTSFHFQPIEIDHHHEDDQAASKALSNKDIKHSPCQPLMALSQVRPNEFYCSRETLTRNHRIPLHYQ